MHSVTQGVAGAIANDPNTVPAQWRPGRGRRPRQRPLRLNGSWSIEFWARQISFVHASPGILDKGSPATANGYCIQASPTGALALVRNGKQISSGAGALTSSYRYFVVTYDGARVRWYVNGALATTSSIVFPTNSGNNLFEIGKGDTGQFCQRRHRRGRALLDGAERNPHRRPLFGRFLGLEHPSGVKGGPRDADNPLMSSAASAATPAEGQPAPAPRRAWSSVSRRAGLQLLAGLLVVAGIPVVATVRILDASALRNERARADASLQVQLQQAGDTLQGLADNASSHADDLSRSPALQRAFLTNDRAAIAAIARKNPGVAFYLHGPRVAGSVRRLVITRSTSLAFANGVTVGRVAATLPLGAKLARRLLGSTTHARTDQLLMIRNGVVLGSGGRVRVAGRTVRLGKTSYRGTSAPIANAPGIHLLALRPQHAISASVAPYEHRILYAAIGSFGLLLLAGLLFGGPIVRSLGDFRRVVSQAATDSLTGLANRWRFDEELALEWRRAERVGDSLALILLDLDDFKSVNDTYGHPVGDEVLRQIAQILGRNIRQVDLAARYGGEEFAVIVPEADLEGGRQLAERLRSALESHHIDLPGDRQKAVTASFGVAVKGDLPRAEELIAAADEALYEAKRAGKNRVSPGLPDEETKRARRPSERRNKAPAKKAVAANAPRKSPARGKSQPEG